MLEPEAIAGLNPREMDKLGIEPGGFIRVSTRRGTVVLKARADRDVAEGMVFIPFCFAEAAANLLTNPQLDPDGQDPGGSVLRLQGGAGGDGRGGGVGWVERRRTRPNRSMSVGSALRLTQPDTTRAPRAPMRFARAAASHSHASGWSDRCVGAPGIGRAHAGGRGDTPRRDRRRIRCGWIAHRPHRGSGRLPGPRDRDRGAAPDLRRAARHARSVSRGKDEVCDPGNETGGQAKRGQPLAGKCGALGLVVRAGGDIDDIVKEDRQLDSTAIGEPFTMLIQQMKERGDVI